MINIVIPAAGLGQRFANSSFSNQPKPLISWNNKPMLAHVIENFLEKNVNITIVKQKTLNFVYPHKNVSFVNIDYITNGPAETAYLANIKPNEPLIIVNCDQIIQDWNLEYFLSFAKEFDGVLGCFFSFKNHNSYVNISNDLLVTNVREKEQISNIATNGLHYWKTGQLFIDSYKEMLANNDRVNNEFYVAPTYNYLIKNNCKIGVYMFNRHYPVGTPQDLQRFLKDDYRQD